jgi:transposase-like protein
MSTVRKSYTEEFKREAVRLAKERGNIAATAERRQNSVIAESSNWASMIHAVS